MTRTPWRMLFGVLAVMAVAAIAVACGDDDDEPTATGTTTAAPTGGASSPTTAPATGGTITIAAVQFEHWDPHKADFAQDIAHFYMVWRGLYFLDLKNVPQPMMADGAPQVSSDGKTYTIKLKKDIKWSDGSAITADDFVLGVQRTCNPAIASNYQYLLSNVVGCDDYASAKDKSADELSALRKGVGARAIDPTTVEYKLLNPQPTFPIILTTWTTMPAPAKFGVDSAWGDPLANVYNGPFMPKAYTEKASMELVPNPNWIGEKPKVDKIVLRYIDDAAVAMQAYRAGELDASALPSSELPAVKADSGQSKELTQYPSTRTFGLQFNQRPGSVGEKMEVRLAFSQATDRKQLNTIVFKDVQVPTTNWIVPATSGLQLGVYDSAIGFDLAKAKANLEKAGFKDGAGFPKLTMLLTDTQTNKDLGAYLKDAWKKNLNVDVELEFVDSKTRSSRYNAGDFQLVIGGWQEDYPDPENWIIGLREVGGSINKEACGTAEIDALIDKAKFNTNNEARIKQYQDIEKLVVTTGQCDLPLWHPSVLRMVKPYIKGMAENKRPGDTFVMGDWEPEKWSTTKK